MVEVGVVVPQAKLTSIPWIAKEYGISESLLYRLAGEGNLVGCRRVGGRFFIYQEIFDTWVGAAQVPGNGGQEA